MLYLLATQPALAMKLATLFLSVVRMLAQPAKLRTLGESVVQWLYAALGETRGTRHNSVRWLQAEASSSPLA